MGRIYAGILGLLAMLVVVTRGIKDAAGVEGTLWTAFVGMIVFAIIGWILGKMAEATVQESVQQQMEKELEKGRTQIAK